jgi:hypothetical protein
MIIMNYYIGSRGFPPPQGPDYGAARTPGVAGLAAARMAEPRLS